MHKMSCIRQEVTNNIGFIACMLKTTPIHIDWHPAVDAGVMQLRQTADRLKGSWFNFLLTTVALRCCHITLSQTTLLITAKMALNQNTFVVGKLLICNSNWVTLITVSVHISCHNILKVQTRRHFEVIQPCLQHNILDITIFLQLLMLVTDSMIIQ